MVTGGRIFARDTGASLLVCEVTHPNIAATLLGRTDTATTLQLFTQGADDLGREDVIAFANLVARS